MQALREPARVALKLSEVRAGVALRTYGGVVAQVSRQVAVYDLEVRRILVKAHFEIEDRWPIQTAELFLELDVEDAIRRGPTYRSEYTLAVRCVKIVQIVPIRGKQVAHAASGQANVTELGVSTRELQVAV